MSKVQTRNMNLTGGWETRNASRTRSPSCLSDMGRGAASGGGSQNWRSRERGMIHIHSTDTEIELKKHIAIAKFQFKRWLKGDGQSLNPAMPPSWPFSSCSGGSGWSGRVRARSSASASSPITLTENLYSNLLKYKRKCLVVQCHSDYFQEQRALRWSL